MPTLNTCRRPIHAVGNASKINLRGIFFCLCEKRPRLAATFIEFLHITHIWRGRRKWGTRNSSEGTSGVSFDNILLRMNSQNPNNYRVERGELGESVLLRYRVKQGFVVFAQDIWPYFSKQKSGEVSSFVSLLRMQMYSQRG